MVGLDKSCEIELVVITKKIVILLVKVAGVLTKSSGLRKLL
jgi:hypothetical protein